MVEAVAEPKPEPTEATTTIQIRITKVINDDNLYVKFGCSDNFLSVPTGLTDGNSLMMSV